VYPGALLCILVTSELTCQGVVRCVDGIRQPGDAAMCRQSLAFAATFDDRPPADDLRHARGGPASG
jgi:hypothetical protein